MSTSEKAPSASPPPLPAALAAIVMQVEAIRSQLDVITAQVYAVAGAQHAAALRAQPARPAERSFAVFGSAPVTVATEEPASAPVSDELLDRLPDAASAASPTFST